jgi:hypothetical protein
MIDLSPIPCPDEYCFIGDEELDCWTGQIDAEKLVLAMKSFLKCPACSRLWVYWNGFNEAPVEYVPAAT